MFSAVLRRKIKQSSEIELVLLKCFDVLNNAFPTKFTAARIIMQVIGSEICLRFAPSEHRCVGAVLHESILRKKGSEWLAIIGEINVGGLSFDG